MVKYRSAQFEDIPQLCELMNRQYKIKKNPAYFIWQFFESVYPTSLLCAEDKGKIIGMLGLQKKQLNSGQSCGQIIDMLISPLYRGLGIFGKLIDKSLESIPDLDLICVLPNSNGKNAIIKQKGWQVIHKIDNLKLTKEPLINSNEDYSDKIFSFIYNEKINNWRFHKHPYYNYKRIEHSDREYCYLKIFTNKQDETKKGDIVFVQENKISYEILQKLILNGCKYLFQENIDSVNCWAIPNSMLYNSCISFGFTPEKQERYFCLRSLKYRDKDITLAKNWQIYQADTEFF
ncbi:MAG TPA: GNAT family N-acetyltransferase [Bacteroidales bacterium]